MNLVTKRNGRWCINKLFKCLIKNVWEQIIFLVLLYVFTQTVTYCCSHHIRSSCYIRSNRSHHTPRSLGWCSRSYHSYHNLDSSSCHSLDSNFDLDLKHTVFSLTTLEKHIKWLIGQYCPLALLNRTLTHIQHANSSSECVYNWRKAETISAFKAFSPGKSNGTKKKITEATEVFIAIDMKAYSVVYCRTQNIHRI